jgi:large subunit ribosomal protein L25
MLEGIIRESTGKKATKDLRRDGYLIANIYGKGLDNVNAAFKSNEYIRAVRNKDSIAFSVKVDSKEMNVVVQSYESHPLTGELLHVDLMVAQPGVVTTYMVPVNAIGTPVGLKNKGLLNVAKPRLRVRTTIEALPKTIDINVDDLDVGDAVMIRDIAETLDVKFTDDGRVSVLSMIKAK